MGIFPEEKNTHDVGNVQQIEDVQRCSADVVPKIECVDESQQHPVGDLWHLLEDLPGLPHIVDLVQQPSS